MPLRSRFPIPALAPADWRLVEEFFVDCGAGTGYVPAKSTCRMIPLTAP